MPFRRRGIYAVRLFVVIAGACPAVVVAQTGPPPAQSPGISRKQADAILNELKAIRLLLEKLQTPARPAAVPQLSGSKVFVRYDDGWRIPKQQ